MTMPKDSQSEPSSIRVTLDVPRELASFILSLANAIRSAGTGATGQVLQLVDDDYEAREAELKAENAAKAEARRVERTARHKVIATRAYRDYRRRDRTTTQHSHFLKVLADNYSSGEDQLNPDYMRHLLRQHRLKLKAYLRERQARKVFSLYRLGLTRQQIGTVLGVTGPTISAIFRRNSNRVAQVRTAARRNRRVARHLMAIPRPTYAQIGAAVGLHEKTVARIARELRFELKHVAVARTASVALSNILRK